MPLYEFSCLEHERFEVLLPISDCEVAHHSCPQCGSASERVASLVSMKPDDLWAGHFVEGYGYVTSSSKLDRIRKDKRHIVLNGRDDVEAMKKMAEQGRKDREAKLDRDIKEVFEEGFAGSGVIDSFGAPTPDAFKKLSDEQITSINDDRIP